MWWGKVVGRTVYLGNFRVESWSGLWVRLDGTGCESMHVPPSIDFDTVGSIELLIIKLSLTPPFPLCLDN